MKIGIFGGAFNPPHIGHACAAETAAGELNLDLLLVIPTGISPHKEMPAGTPGPDIRLQMAENAFNGIYKNIQISDIEIYSNESNYTIDTVRAVEREYPGSEICLLVGNDMYDSLSTWKDSETLLKIVTPILLPRNIINISSTQIRDILPLRRGKEYLHDKNYALIIKHRLYGARPDWDWLRSRACSMLDSKRIQHVRGCEFEATKLAVHWGENADEAREAAILHDITKKLDFNENMCIISQNGLVTNDYNKSEEKLLHALTGALLAKSEYGVSDAVANAIRLHTTGAAGMSMLDKIIYVADYIEPGRDFDGISELREYAYSDIDKAMITGLQMTIDDLNRKKIKVNTSTYDALRSLSGSTTI